MLILLVDDHIPSNVVMQRFLEYAQHTGIAVVCGSGALEMLLAKDFDAVFMDIVMPGMSGMELTRLIRDGKAGEKNIDMYIVAVTACAMAGDREICLAAGMDDYLSKPIGMGAVEAILTRVPAREIAA